MKNAEKTAYANHAQLEKSGVHRDDDIDQDKENGANALGINNSDSEVPCYENSSDSDLSCYEDATSSFEPETELEDGEIDNNEQPQQSRKAIDGNSSNNNNDAMTGKQLLSPISTKRVINGSSSGGDISLSMQLRPPISDDTYTVPAPLPPPPSPPNPITTTTPLRYATMEPPKPPSSLRHANVHSFHPNIQLRPPRLTDMRPLPPAFLRYTSMRPPTIPSSFRQHASQGYVHQTTPRRHQYQRGSRLPSLYQQDYYQWFSGISQRTHHQRQPMNSISTTRSQHYFPRRNQMNRRRNQ
ncbi:hypothetical protein BCR42DRAFT_407844 [Absidia repens]|uniref:Uncharacterized protein n=1 Tax=Absidia repens TaxID=90262 RepID=A0A1X2ISU6_9FUNG|nr:hypothetical protein BCR42DRAFT_407844 [Absidia repens]